MIDFSSSISGRLTMIQYGAVMLVALIFCCKLLAQDMEEVIVQATKTDAADTADIAASVEAFDMEDLINYKIEGFADVANFVPGVTASPSGSQGLRFAIRGIGARDTQLGVESRVALYIDDAFLGRSTGVVFDLADLEQVEVHKGPVGSRGGRNAVGGSINLITAKASVEEFKAKLTAGAGNFDSRTISGMLNIPISDTFALRGSGIKNVREGWVKNNGVGVDFHGFDRESFRVSASWFASEAISIYYSFDYSDAINQPAYQQSVPFFDGDPQRSLTLGFATAVPQVLSAPALRDPVTDKRQNETSATFEIENGSTEGLGHTLNMNFDWSESHALQLIGTYRELESINSFSYFPNVDQDELTFRTIRGAIAGANAARILTGGGTISVQLLDQFGAFSETLGGFDLDAPFEYAVGIEEWSQFLRRDFASAGLPSVSTANAFPRLDSLIQSPAGGVFGLKDHKQFSIEVKQSGVFLDDQLEYLFGAYYFNERTGNGPNNRNGEPWLDGLELLSVLAIDPFEPNPNANIIGFSAFGENRLNTDSYAAYTDWRFTPGQWLDGRLHLSVGLRWTRDDRAVFRQPLTAFTLDPRRIITNQASLAELERTAVTIRSSDSWSSVDPSIKLEYDIIDDGFIYFSYAESYRPGSFNVLVRDDSDLTLKFEEESISAWELGFKGSLFDGFWAVEAAGYFYQQDDAQQTVFFELTPLIRSTVNADAYTAGIELNQSFQLTDNLSLRVDYGYLESKSDEFINPFVPQFSDRGPLDPTNLGDLETFFSPFGTINPDNPALPMLIPDRNGNGIAGEQGDVPFVRRILSRCGASNQRVDLTRGACVESKDNFGSPRNSWLVSLDYFALMPWGEFRIHGDYSFTESHTVGDNVTVSDRNIFGMRMSFGIETKSGLVNMALWSQNLFDNEYTVEATAIDFATDTVVFGTPRTFGIDVSYEWF